MQLHKFAADPKGQPSYADGRRFAGESGSLPDGQGEQLLGVLLRRWRPILSLSLLGMMLLGIGTLFFLPRYTATALLIVGGPLNGGSSGHISSATATDDTVVDTHISMLLTRENLQRVANSFDTAPAANSTIRGSSQPSIGPMSVDEILGRVRISQERRSRVIAIKYTSRNAVEAAITVNRIAEFYVQNFVERSRAATMRHLETLSTRSPQLRDEIEQAGAVAMRIRATQGTDTDIQILSLAAPPSQPSSVNPMLFLGLSFVLFTIVGSLVAVVSEQMDNVLRSERDVAQALAIPCLGLVPQMALSNGVSPHRQLLLDPCSIYAEAIRSIATTTLDLDEPGRNSHVVLVTSSVPGEGKTMLALSLATYAASIGHRTLLIDLDCRKPTTQLYLGTTWDRTALTQLLNGRPHAEVVKTIPELKFDYIPSPSVLMNVGQRSLGNSTGVQNMAGRGSVERNTVDPVMLFAGSDLPRVLDELRTSYDCIIIDAAPLLAVTETRLLAPLADKIIFAVRWAHNRQVVAQNALSLLINQSAHSKYFYDITSAVVTRVDLQSHARYRYGDRGETFVKYSEYYSPSETVWAGPKERLVAQLRNIGAALTRNASATMTRKT